MSHSLVVRTCLRRLGVHVGIVCHPKLDQIARLIVYSAICDPGRPNMPGGRERAVRPSLKSDTRSQNRI
jgi:hypothetical protein